jgi:hypothetical protein
MCPEIIEPIRIAEMFFAFSSWFVNRIATEELREEQVA